MKYRKSIARGCRKYVIVIMTGKSRKKKIIIVIRTWLPGEKYNNNRPEP